MVELSHTEENYLKAIYHLSSDGMAVSTNSLASSMQTTPASTNDMMKRLMSKGLITHIKYQGANITSSGKNLALQVIRKHRLWEVFLFEKLHFNWDEVHELAEQLEHIKSPILTDRLDDFLGNPKMDPHGDPIPDRNGKINIGSIVPLSQLKISDQGTLTSVGTDDASLLQYLDSIQIRLGTKIEVKAVVSFDHSFEIMTDKKPSIFISNKVAELLLITKSLDNG
jgi:DtxR family Mn-dependent transcriptional regulator